MKVYKVALSESASPYCDKDMSSVAAALESVEVGDTATVEVVEMTEEEYSKLPESLGP